MNNVTANAETLCRRGLFITGTDTGVGKTVVSALVMERYRRSCSVTYWKPIQTGVPPEDDTQTVAELTGCCGDEIEPGCYRFREPASPLVASRKEHHVISVEGLAERARRLSERRALIVEGAGGLLVPVNEGQMMIDLALAMMLPVVVVALARIGAINHTLLTLEALARAGLPVAGVVVVGDPQIGALAEMVEKFGRVRVVSSVPWLMPFVSRQNLTACALRSFDSEGMLEGFLGAAAAPGKAAP